MRLMNQPPETLEEQYFSKIRPLLYERHTSHHQSGVREGRTLAEHFDSACQFVLTVSRIAEVPDDTRKVILAATAVHDLNKLDQSKQSVKKLARDRAFLKQQLEYVGVDCFVTDDGSLELARRLIERHSGHHATDGTLFIAKPPELEDLDRWAAILIAADLFDLNLPQSELDRKIEKELTVALDRPSRLYRIRVSEDRGYISALLLAACEEVLSGEGLTPLAIFPDGELFEGERLPEKDLVNAIALRWQTKIDAVFGNNIEQLVKPSNNGIRILSPAVQHDHAEVLQVVLACLEKKRKNCKAETLQKDVEKWSRDAGAEAVLQAQAANLFPASTADEYMISEGLKAAFISYRQGLSTEETWNRIAAQIGLSSQQREALEKFDPQYGRALFAAKAMSEGLNGIKNALLESLEMRKTLVSQLGSDEEISEAPKELVELVSKNLNLPYHQLFNGFAELKGYTDAKPKQRCSLGVTVTATEDVSSMPIGTKVQVFSNRLPGGMIAEPRRQAEPATLLAYQLLAIGARFPAVKKEPPFYLHLALPKGSCPELLRIWRECLTNLAATNASNGPVSVDAIQLYRDNAIEFRESKVVGFAFPSRPEFVHNTVVLPIVWGEVNASIALLKSLRLALELSLSLELGFPFVLSSSLQIETSTDFYGRVEGIPTALMRLLSTGRYSRENAIVVRDRLRSIGRLVQGVASLPKFDDCLYDLARATSKPFSLYHVLLRWILREQDNPNLEVSWQKIRNPLNHLLESLMPNENSELTQYLREAARLAAHANLRGSSFRRTSLNEPFTAFVTAIRSVKPHMDLDFIFGALVQKYHTRLDRIRETGVGETKFEQIKQYYSILRKLYEEVYRARPEKLLNDRDELEAAYLFFWQEAYQEVKAKKAAELKTEETVESNP
ncbi:hypothetical protein [Leptolyngbya sp. NIES-2104]|uniref:hypothetical protein n=1 Tax=Leptolyngbya sp. NIES-2104 TaxID=1552121 RepID=UPI0006EC91DB|nr:hypothetical protein [Leptolyngbya sp. NIES-2104]GAP94328.1 hypothetical protein NIES2104_08390 [Leptolyngbya sp. NIES-2104]